MRGGRRKRKGRRAREAEKERKGLTTTTARAFFGTLLGEIHADLAAIEFLVVHGIYGLFGSVGGFKGDKTEATRAVGFAIAYDFRFGDLAVRFEGRAKGRFIGCPGQSANKDLFRHSLILQN